MDFLTTTVTFLFAPMANTRRPFDNIGISKDKVKFATIKESKKRVATVGMEHRNLSLRVNALTR
jgi:hypothetical protein